MPLDRQSRNVLQENQETVKEIKFGVYSDEQNAHDSEMVKSFKKALKSLNQKWGKRLFSRDEMFKEIENLIEDLIENRTRTSKLSEEELQRAGEVLQSMKDETKRGEGDKYEGLKSDQILEMIWERIKTHYDKEKDELLKLELESELRKILIGQLADSHGKCSQGRIERIVQTLDGFEEDIRFSMDIEDQIINYIMLRLEKMMKSREDYETLRSYRDPMLRVGMDTTPLAEFIKEKKTDLEVELRREFEESAAKGEIAHFSSELFDKAFTKGIEKFKEGI